MTQFLTSLVQASRPRSHHGHWLATEHGGVLYLANGSRIFDIDRPSLDHLNAMVSAGEPAMSDALAALGIDLPAFIDDRPVQSPPLRAVSLAIAQKCNLGCTYCYASHGDFGGAPRNMTMETAFRAIDLLFANVSAGDRVNVAFLGGEPLINRRLLRSATEYAVSRAEVTGASVTFSITTNGTLLNEDDSEFFERHGFSVTVSLDGPRDAHDAQRPRPDGSGSYDHIIARVQPLLRRQQAMQVSVRATVTPHMRMLRKAMDDFLDMGFHSVGFSPVLHSPYSQGEMGEDDLIGFLGAMIECGDEFERRVVRGERYAFSNMVNAMRELHRGTHRPYPCGAGAGYLGVAADGDLAACHRFVGEEGAAMGNVSRGIDRERQNHWLAERHVHRQSPCTECWARYLCGGGCHHEVIKGGRHACDYIRGWLHYSLGAYARLRQAAPQWFEAT